MSASNSLLAIFNFVLFATSISIDAGKDGFSVELISIDYSPKSPMYNPNETPIQRVVNALRRSVDRVKRFNQTKNNDFSTDDVVSDLVTFRGNYMMKISLGTPAFEIQAIADTGSDLIWTQCQPCDSCYPQDAPIFNPERTSSTYGYSLCDKTCDAFQEITKCDESHICRYHSRYEDGSFSKGILSLDTLTVRTTTGEPFSFDAIFGCGHRNIGIFNIKTSGIVGLGGGPKSFVSQMGLDGKFSYCLLSPYADYSVTSKMNFGVAAIVSGEGVQSTPFISRYKGTFYFLTLEAISVGNQRIQFLGSSFGGWSGNIVIDSGTTLTLLPNYFFEHLYAAVIGLIAGTPVQDPTSNGLKPCYTFDQNIEVPKFTVHFTGANLDLKPDNIFIVVAEGVLCFAFKATNVGAIFGSVAHSNFLVGYDLVGKTVSFKPTDCTQG